MTKERIQGQKAHAWFLVVRCTSLDFPFLFELGILDFIDRKLDEGWWLKQQCNVWKMAKCTIHSGAKGKIASAPFQCHTLNTIYQISIYTIYAFQWTTTKPNEQHPFYIVEHFFFFLFHFYCPLLLAGFSIRSVILIYLDSIGERLYAVLWCVWVHKTWISSIVYVYEVSSVERIWSAKYQCIRLFSGLLFDRRRINDELSFNDDDDVPCLNFICYALWQSIMPQNISEPHIIKRWCNWYDEDPSYKKNKKIRINERLRWQRELNSKRIVKVTTN